MSGRHLARPRPALFLAALIALAHVATPVVSPAQAAEEDPPSCNQEVPTEQTAIELAKACGGNVQVTGELTEYRDVTVTPEGKGFMTAYVEPVRARTAAGKWAPIDTTLRKAADGSIGPVNAVLPVRISGGGSGPFATLTGDGKSFGLSWPGKLPAPSFSGATATYADVLPGVDLTVTAKAEGFSHNVVVKTRQAAQNPALSRISLAVTTRGVTAKSNGAGGAVVVDGDGKPFVIGSNAWMWDDADTAAEMSAPAANSERAPVKVEVATGSVVLTPDHDMLTAEDTQFPVVIDPPWTGYRYDGEWGSVWENHPTTSYWKDGGQLYNVSTLGDAGVGRVCDVNSNGDCISSTYRVRTFFRISTEYVTRSESRVVIDGTFKIEQRHSWNCNATAAGKARVYKTSLFQPGHTWNNQPQWTSTYATSPNDANNGYTCPGYYGNLEFDVTSMVKAADADSAASVPLGMHAIDETDVNQWKRYDPSSARITIWFNTLPGVPTGRTAAGAGCGSATNPVWVKSARPQMRAKFTDADGQVRGEFRLYTASGWQKESYLSPYENSGTTVTFTPPSDLAENSLYQWRVRGYDGRDYGDFSTFCGFKVDKAPPTGLKIERTDGDSRLNVGDSVTLSFSATDTVSGVKGFYYGKGTEATDSWVPASGGKATITWSNLPKGAMVYVKAQDVAGHTSTRAHLHLGVGEDVTPTPAGAWRLNGEAFDDTNDAPNDDLTLPSGASWTVDRTGAASSAVKLSGADDECLSTSNSVIRTDGSYTLSAWARLDGSVDTSQTVLAQAGSTRSAFELRYNGTTKKWGIGLPTTDSATPAWQSLDTDVTAEVGRWTHVAATFDAVAKTVRFYIGGQVAAERSFTYTPWHAAGPLLVGCAGSASSRSNEFNGAIDNVGVWTGRLTQAEIQRAMVELPAALMGHWDLTTGTGEDWSRYTRALTIPPSAAWKYPDGDTRKNVDQYSREDVAMLLDGQPGSCAETNGQIVRGNESFTVSAWVKLDQGASGNAVVLAQADESQPGFVLRYDEGSDAWLLFVQADTGQGLTLLGLKSTVAADEHDWTHLVAVIDATDKVARLYVNGEPAGQQQLAHAPASGSHPGPFLVGCEGRTSDGARWNHLYGAVEGVAVHRGVLTADEIDDVFANPAIVEEGIWPLQGPDLAGEPREGLTDVSGKDRDLTSTSAAQWTSNRASQLNNALRIPADAPYCAETAGTVVRTNASFTVAAWVRLDDLAADKVVLSQPGTTGTTQTFQLMYRANTGWRFQMASADGTTKTVTSPPATSGKWHHVAAVYDIHANQMQLYVDDADPVTAVGPASPWHVDGKLRVGCLASASGSGRGSYLAAGSVDEVRAWTSTVHEDHLKALGRP